jgi:hypothetical protein
MVELIVIIWWVYTNLKRVLKKELSKPIARIMGHREKERLGVINIE